MQATNAKKRRERWTGQNLNGEPVIVETRKSGGLLVKTIRRDRPNECECAVYRQDGTRENVLFIPLKKEEAAAK